jgi:GntR family transcriptional regulator/MocR family aminotransferase
VLPAWLTDAVAEQKALDDLASPALEQLAFADLLDRGEVDRHLRRNRARYRARRDALVTALAVHAPQVRAGGIVAGLHVVTELPSQTDEAAVVAAARRHSVGASPMGDYRFGGHGGPAALVQGYGGLGEPAIKRGVPCSHSPSPVVDGVHPPSQGSDAGSRYSLRVSVMPLACGDPVQP